MTKDDLERKLTKSEAIRQEQQHEIAALKEALLRQVHENEELSVKMQAALARLRHDTYSEAVRAYGKQSQLVMAIEEMSKLTKELSKNICGASNVSAISEEIADVEIMLEQLKIIFANRSEVDLCRCAKLDRLVSRLADGQA